MNENVNDFVTSAENIFEEEVFVPALVKVLDPDRFASVNKDLVGLPHDPELWYDEDPAAPAVVEEGESGEQE